MREAYIRLLSTGEMFSIEYLIQKKDGSWIWLHAKAMSSYRKDGQRRPLSALHPMSPGESKPKNACGRPTKVTAYFLSATWFVLEYLGRPYRGLQRSSGAHARVRVATGDADAKHFRYFITGWKNGSLSSTRLPRRKRSRIRN